MTATTAPSGATHRNARESLAAPGAPHTAGASTPALTTSEPLGGRTPAQLASLEGCGQRGAGAAAAGYVTRDEMGRLGGSRRPEEESEMHHKDTTR